MTGLPGRAIRRAALRLLPLLVAVPALAAAPPRSTPGWLALERARSYFRAIRADSAVLLVEQVLRTPEAGRDPALAAAAHLVQGAALAMTSRAREAEPVLREAARAAEAARDSNPLGVALRYLGFSLSVLGRGSESAATYQHLLRFSLARGDSLNEAYARLGIAYGDLLAGRCEPAERGYQRAMELFGRKGEGFMLRNANVGLCRCYEGEDRFDDARRCYRELDIVCREAGDENNRSSVLNNLGAIEHMTGDLAAAEQAYRAAYELSRSVGREVGAVAPAGNLALVQMEQGRLRDAGVVLEQVLAGSRRAGYRLGEIQVLNRLAGLRVAERRYPEAAEFIRHGLALADSVPAPQRTNLITTFGRTLARMDRRAEAIARLEAESRRLRGDVNAVLACELRLELSEQQLGAGRAADALRSAHQALLDARRAGSLDLEFRARVREGLALLERGDAVAARATLEDATTLWEANRGRQRDPEAREYLSTSARDCVGGLITSDLAGASVRDSNVPAAASAADPRCAAVFGAIERFKARTLRERMVGPWKAPADSKAVGAPVALAELQRSVLRDGELLIETFVHPGAGVMVAVTRDECRLVPILIDAGFRMRLQRLRSLAARREPADPDGRFVADAGSRLGATLLAPLRDLLAGCTRVIVSPDEELGVIPWAIVALPEGGSASPAALIAGREVVLTPSASIFADLRRRAVAVRGTAPLRVLGVAGARGGDVLPGASGEVRWLAGHFHGVDAGSDAAGAVLATPARLEPYDVLHLAAHTTLDDEHPWRSGIRLGGGGDEGALRAERISALRLNARLAVLSSCESASGRIAAGEGVQSLSAAFVSAGVTATVATLWPVSDRATERLMQAFYRHLAAGRTVAGALRAAQLEIRARPETRHPFYWAGFVVLGDGDVRVPLRARPPLAPVAAAAGAAAVVLGALGWRRGRSLLTNPGRATLTS